MKSIKIEIPEGFEVDKEKSTFTEIIFKKIEFKLPQSWEDIDRISGYYTTGASNIMSIDSKLRNSEDKCIWPTKELAQASLALSQLCQLRDAWREGWIPDWTSAHSKYVIHVMENRLIKESYYVYNSILSFQTEKLRDDFFETFKDLLEIAKPLL
jgi:hypothetical protein